MVFIRCGRTILTSLFRRTWPVEYRFLPLTVQLHLFQKNQWIPFQRQERFLMKKATQSPIWMCLESVHPYGILLPCPAWRKILFWIATSERTNSSSAFIPEIYFCLSATESFTLPRTKTIRKELLLGISGLTILPLILKSGLWNWSVKRMACMSSLSVYRCLSWKARKPFTRLRSIRQYG